MEKPVRVDAAGKPDESVDGADDKYDRERVLPQWDADEGAAGGEHERRGQREDGEQAGERPVRVTRRVAKPAQ